MTVKILELYAHPFQSLDLVRQVLCQVVVFTLDGGLFVLLELAQFIERVLIIKAHLCLIETRSSLHLWIGWLNTRCHVTHLALVHYLVSSHLHRHHGVWWGQHLLWLGQWSVNLELTRC